MNDPSSKVNLYEHGFVRLDGSMADDLSVVNAARVSFARHKEVMDLDDIGLVKWLMKERHTSPFEHNAFRFHVRAPIFVAREWFRHRMGCLTADTLITCYMPTGKAYPKTIKQIHDLKHGVTPEFREWFRNGLNKKGQQAWTKRMPRRQRNYRSLSTAQTRMLRVLNEETGLISAAPMNDVWETGVKEVFTVSSGTRSIRASADHRFLTPEGWKKVSDLDRHDLVAYPGHISYEQRPYPPALRAGIGVWTEMMRVRLIKPVDQCYICGMVFEEKDLQLDHVVPVVVDLSLALDERNLKPACRPCHRIKTTSEQKFSTKKHRFGKRWTRIDGRPILAGEEMTYDISVDGPHNFEAGKFIVHNSFNEFSMRYAKASDEFHVPYPEDIRSQVGKPGHYTFEPVDDETAGEAISRIEAAYDHAYETYLALLEKGVAREVARMVMPVGAYTEFYWTVNAHSALHFISLRSAPDAQREIQTYAMTVEGFVAELMPITHQAWVDRGRFI